MIVESHKKQCMAVTVRQLCRPQKGRLGQQACCPVGLFSHLYHTAPCPPGPVPAARKIATHLFLLFTRCPLFSIIELKFETDCGFLAKGSKGGWA